MSRLNELQDGPYSVVLTPNALDGYEQIQARQDIRAVNKTLDMLAEFPLIGHLYDPVYAAARPPFPVRVAYSGHKAVFYEVFPSRKRVRVISIEDQRMDPAAWFGGMVDSV